MSGPSLDAVVVTYASREDIARCLGSVRAIADLGTVVVVDHGDDGSADVASAEGAVVVRDPANPGFGAGHNRGVLLTDAPFVLLMNPDAEVVPGAVEAGVALLTARPEAAAVQGVIVDASTGVPERSQGVVIGPGHLWGRVLRLRALLRWRTVRAVVRRMPGFADHVERVPRGPTETSALGATALVVRRSAFDAVGGFDERYFLYGEDMDLCRRLRDAGWTLVALPTPWATHRAGTSSRSSWRREMEWWRGTMTYAATWYRPGAWALSVAAAVVRAVTLAVRSPRGTAVAFRAVVGEPLRQRRSRRR